MIRRDPSLPIESYESRASAAWESSTRLKNLKLGRHVALKFLPPEMAQESQAQEPPAIPLMPMKTLTWPPAPRPFHPGDQGLAQERRARA